MNAFLEALGLRPDAVPEIAGTAARVARMYAEELLAGYRTDPRDVLRSHRVSGETTIVSLRDVPVSTVCPHHLLLAHGVATVAFAPQGTLVGVGALGEVLAVCTRRLALQEEVGENVVRSVAEELRPRWVVCRIVLRHGCMFARGDHTRAPVETVAVRATDDASRSEAMQWMGLYGHRRGPSEP
jgi:GTP cyclohydrolase I